MQWVARYYIQPIGEVIKAALPTGTRLRSREVYAITPKGMETLATGPGESLESKILRSLKRPRGKRFYFSPGAEKFLPGRPTTRSTG